MKQLICEMCGSNDLIKQDGVFVCQSCGCKYAVEEAKKMMVEGTVEVTGTVKIDTSNELENLYQLARRAKDTGNNENATKYYDMILIKDPSSWEATFYSFYYRLADCKVADINSEIVTLTNNISIVFNLIKIHNKKEIAQYISEMYLSMTKLIEIVKTAAKSHYESLNYSIQPQHLKTYIISLINTSELMYKFGDLCEDYIDEVKIKEIMVKSFVQGTNCITEADCYLQLNVKFQLFNGERELIWSSKDRKDTYEKKRTILHNQIKSNTITNIEDECHNQSYESLLLIAKKYLEKAGDQYLNNQYANIVFDKAIKKDPTSVLGYIGKAVCSANVICSENLVEASKREIKESDKEYLCFLLTYKRQGWQTLLMSACETPNCQAVKFLIELGVDINDKDLKGATALWHISCQSLTQPAMIKHIDEYRYIAWLLIENGATFNINALGVDLYNKDTDSEIEKLILAKSPNMRKGNCITLPTTPQKSGCYVATCVYGSYDCPQVWTLRRFRDNTLAKTTLGRAFIRTYYAISPTLVKWFENTAWFKEMWKSTLDKMVSKLQENGVEDSPYEDKNW